MAKGQMKGDKEAKKPKGCGSTYKLSQGAPSGAAATNPFAKKKVTNRPRRGPPYRLAAQPRPPVWLDRTAVHR
jgi:hypothetical protein